MTPKEKAKELVDKFLEEMPKYLQGKLGRETAKQSALICIDDKISFIKELQVNGLMKLDLVEGQLLIKEEIEKLI
tara:strand:+ start:48 stop:272 length:225 start_codon:yes stop_codon:yes gene_type:complete